MLIGSGRMTVASPIWYGICPRQSGVPVRLKSALKRSELVPHQDRVWSRTGLENADAAPPVAAKPSDSRSNGSWGMVPSAQLVPPALSRDGGAGGGGAAGGGGVTTGGGGGRGGSGSGSGGASRPSGTGSSAGAGRRSAAARSRLAPPRAPRSRRARGAASRGVAAAGAGRAAGAGASRRGSPSI